MALADELIEITDTAQQNENARLLEAQKAILDREAAEAAAIREEIESEFPNVVEQIKQAAAAGSNTYAIAVGTIVNGQEPEHALKIKLGVWVEMLTNEGIKAVITYNEYTHNVEEIDVTSDVYVTAEW